MPVGPAPLKPTQLRRVCAAHEQARRASQRERAAAHALGAAGALYAGAVTGRLCGLAVLSSLCAHLACAGARGLFANRALPLAMLGLKPQTLLPCAAHAGPAAGARGRAGCTAQGPGAHAPAGAAAGAFSMLFLVQHGGAKHTAGLQRLGSQGRGLFLQPVRHTAHHGSKYMGTRRPRAGATVPAAGPA